MFEQMSAQIVLGGIAKSYVQGGKRIPALFDINLRIEEEEFVCLAGPSGSGKSTLLHLLGALDQPSAGIIHVAGQEISCLNRRESALFRRNAIGFVFQSFNLIPALTAGENVEYPLIVKGIAAQERKKRTAAMLSAVGLAHLADSRVIELSGGEQQRVAVARALVAKPCLVLADEPTGNLDSTTGTSIINLMRRLNRELGATVIYSSHDPQIIAMADRVIVLQDGQIVTDRARQPTGG